MWQCTFSINIKCYTLHPAAAQPPPPHPPQFSVTLLHMHTLPAYKVATYNAFYVWRLRLRECVRVLVWFSASHRCDEELRVSSYHIIHGNAHRARGNTVKRKSALQRSPCVCAFAEVGADDSVYCDWMMELSLVCVCVRWDVAAALCVSSRDCSWCVFPLALTFLSAVGWERRIGGGVTPFER